MMITVAVVYLVLRYSKIMNLERGLAMKRRRAKRAIAKSRHMRQ